MKKRLALSIIGFIVVSIIGTLLHFLYGACPNPLTKIISPTDESVFEHLKLFFYPMLLFTLFEYALYGKHQVGFIRYKVLAIALGLFTIIGGYYLYTSFTHKPLLYIDIPLFYIAIFNSFAFPYHMLNKEYIKSNNLLDIVSVVFLIGILIALIVFTYIKPELGIFQEYEQQKSGLIDHLNCSIIRR